MKLRLLIGTALATFLLTALLSEAQSSKDKEADDLDRLKTTYEQKRADALKPVNNWYETQLQTMLKKRTQKGDFDGAVRFREELAALKEVSSKESHVEFKKALVATTWSWTGDPNQKGVETTFKDQPLVTHVGLCATWNVTGPREVTIQANTGTKYVLRFDPQMTSYQTDDGTIFGRRWK
jgi:hypothetical protein